MVFAKADFLPIFSPDTALFFREQFAAKRPVLAKKPAFI